VDAGDGVGRSSRLALNATLIAVVVTVALTGIVSPAEAQEPQDLTSLSPEELIGLPARSASSASNYLNRITDAPSSVSIITAEEIRLYGYRTLAEVLNSVRGISVSYDRNYTYLGLRGLSRPGDLNTRIMVIIDGHRLNDNVFDSALVGDEFPVDLENIERVEIIRGPGGAVYGTSAFSAVISVITKQGGDVHGLEGMASLQTFDTRRVRATWGTAAGGPVRLLVSGSAATSDGQPRLYFREFDTPATGGFADGADGQRVGRLAMNLEAGHFSMHGVYAARLKHIPTASFGTRFNDSRTRTFDERGYADVQYARELGRRSEVMTRAYWDHYRYNGWYVFENDGDAAILNRDFVNGSWVGSEVSLSHRVSTRHLVTAGAEYRHNMQQEQRNYDEPPHYVLYLDDRRHVTTWATSLQDEVHVHSRLKLHAAVRYESVPTGSARITPKIGVITHPSAASTVKLLFSRGLRSPSVYERFYESPPNYISNPSLSPERVQTVEVVVEHAVSPWARISGSVFANRVNGVIVTQEDDRGLISFVNGRNTATHGVEVSWVSDVPAGIHVRVSYAALDNSQEESAVWFGGAPTQLAKINVGSPIKRLGVTTGVSVAVAGTRRAHTGEMFPPVAVANWNVVRPIGKDVEIQGALFNLFNVRYSEPASTDHLQGGISQDGRQIAVKLLWRVH
jgi:outer membrane receptor for ferrienterochelin and colicin